ncbi:MAG: hypothetical protein KDA21_00130 [Phycisphaerales bacterium]|nr:hypothetical protein [Phycisphaerales bacterium]
MRFACVGVTLAGLVGVGSASGAYMVAATSNGMSSRTVQPGNSFQLDIELSSDASDQINSAILRLVFSDAGLQYNAYDWSDPFEDGSITDDSTPGTPELPALIDADSLAGVGYPAGVVDVELSNVILTSSRFGSGVLISLTLTVPSDWAGEDTVVISTIPDTLANGFNEVMATPGQAFTLVIPTPAASLLAGAAGWVVVRRRR